MTADDIPKPTKWGVPNLLVLNAMPNETRLEDTMELLGQISDGRGSTSFLFQAIPDLRRNPQAYRRARNADLMIFSV